MDVRNGEFNIHHANQLLMVLNTIEFPLAIFSRFSYISFFRQGKLQICQARMYVSIHTSPLLFLLPAEPSEFLKNKMWEVRKTVKPNIFFFYLDTSCEIRQTMGRICFQWSNNLDRFCAWCSNRLQLAKQPQLLS